MMVETILESSQDFGMSNGSLPQWKRELLQRRASRPRPPAPPPAPPAPPPPPPPADDEELRYGPGIVKRLKSRYLSLALRDAPRRRASVLRRAASLEHLLDAPAAPRAPRPASLAAPPAPPAPPRRDLVKRARSVDALSRLEEADAAPRTRPPRRPVPLLRDTERPPPDVVRAALRKFESAPPRRTAPAARVSAVLRGLEGPRCSTPEPRARSPSPAAADLSAIDEPEGAVLSAKPVSRAALEGIARAGSSVRYSFEAAKSGSHLPSLPAVAATNPVLLNRARLWSSPRRVGVIRPMPAAPPPATPPPPPPLDECAEKAAEEPPRAPTPPTQEPPTPERKEPPSALVEPIPRAPVVEPRNEITPMEVPCAPSPPPRPAPPSPRERTPEPTEVAKPEPRVTEAIPKPAPLLNGHSEPPRAPEPKARTPSRIGTAGIERAWTGAKAKKSAEVVEEKKEVEEKKAVGWARKPRPPAPASTSIVFNFSNRKEVPDYIENDGIILRTSRRNRIKPGEPGVVVLRPEALARDSGSESDGEPERPPSPCAVRFVNDNVLINGKSSMSARPDRQRIAKLKLQFDDSLTRTFEYPSETSLCEESPAADLPAPASASVTAFASAPAPAPASATLAANTHLASGSLGRYTPSKTHADSFQLGLTRPHTESEATGIDEADAEAEPSAEAVAEAEAEDARPCAADAARSWSDARALSTDLLF